MADTWLTSILVGIGLMIIAFVIIPLGSEIPLLINIGWVILVGGIAIFGLSIYSKIRS